MGLFDKIKDNAKSISIKAIDGTRDDYEYDDRFDDYQADQTQPQQITPTTTTVLEDNVEGEDFVETIELEKKKAEEEKPKTDEKAEEPEKEDDKEKESKEDTKTARKSKVTEISKADHEKAEKEKRQDKAKQAAKERLAKTYVPSYKSPAGSAAKKAPAAAAKATTPVKPVARVKSIGIIDVTPNKFQTPAKGTVYARERVALSVIASQRKLNGTVPLYTSAHMNFKTRVYIDRVEYSGSFGKSVLPINQITWIKLRHSGTGVILETTDNKKVVMVVKPADRLAFADAVLKVQALQPKRGKFKDTQTVRIDQLERFGQGVDEIEQLAKLYDKGILSQEEFDAKKKQILGI